jgi:hypothetical protein
VKADLETHLGVVNGLPDHQHGFMPKCSCGTALSHAPACWTKGVKAGKVVAVMAFDLTAAFNTVAADQLLPKLESLGVSGTPLSWFSSYLRGSQQCVDWDGGLSPFLEIKYGVSQGLLLGPLLFIILVGDMALYLGVGDDCLLVYANDTTMWAISPSVAEAVNSLTNLAAYFVEYTKANGLALNAAKTHLLFSTAAKYTSDVTVSVDGNAIAAKDTVELLGV